MNDDLRCPENALLINVPEIIIFPRKVLDVGCRLGAVLYGAAAFSRAAAIAGIEINADFVQVRA